MKIVIFMNYAVRFLVHLQAILLCGEKQEYK